MNQRTVDIAAVRRLIREGLPTGAPLPENVWRFRHAVIRWLLVGHASALTLFGLWRGYDLWHIGGESSLILAAAFIAGLSGLSQGTRSVAATLGLVGSSAMMVHLSGGTIEAHFHFFVILGIISLYQRWLPLVAALAFVLVHHGIIGVLNPSAVYNHAAAIAHPWRWATIHAGFVLAATVVNVVAWRLNELARAESALIISSVSDGIIAIDPDGRITSMNPAAKRQLGLSSEDAVGASAHDLLHGSTHGPMECPLISANEDGSRTIDTFTTDDGDVPVEYTRSSMARRGHQNGWVVVFTDLSARVSAEATLHRTLSLLKATLESTADGILVVDVEGRITASNQRFAQMWHIPPDVIHRGDDEESIATVLSQLEDPGAFIEKVRELYGQAQAQSFDVLRFKDGRVFERLSQPQLVEGETVGRVWSFRDVTERFRLDQMKDAFLSAVSHELRTPLTGILGYAVTLQASGEAMTPELRREITARLEVCARKLHRLLNDTIDLDRLSRGIIAPMRAPTEMGVLVRRITEDLDMNGRRVIVHDEGVIASVDAAKVERLVENLLLNGLRHTPEGSPLEVTVVGLPGGGVELTVEDRGAGVPEDERDAIFGAFQQGTTVAKHSPGFGIGLSLVANLADLHGGRAWVEDRPGGGARFRVTLPPQGRFDPSETIPVSA